MGIGLEFGNSRRGARVRVAMIAVGVTVLAVAGAAVAGGQPQQTPTTIHACIHRSNGAVRIVDPGATCRQAEAPMSWNIAGPAGSAGPQGPAGPAGPAGPGISSIDQLDGAACQPPGGTAGQVSVEYGQPGSGGVGRRGIDLTCVTGETLPPPPTRPVAVEFTGNGTGTVTFAPAAETCTTSCTRPFSTTDSVQVSAMASPGSLFVGFGGACNGGTCYLPAGITAHAVIVQFAPDPVVSTATFSWTGEAGRTVFDVAPNGDSYATIDLSGKQAARVNSAGEVLWSLTYPQESPVGSAIDVSPFDGAVHVTGSESIGELDEDGNVTSTTTVAAPSGRQIQLSEVVATVDGGVVAVGTSRRLPTVDNPTDGIFAVKLDAAGQVAWSRSLEGFGVEVRPVGVALTTDGGLVIGVRRHAFEYPRDPLGSEIVVLESADGTTRWTRLLPSAIGDGLNDVATGPDGGVVVVTYYRIMSLDGIGTTRWERTDVGGHDAAVLPDGTLAVLMQPRRGSLSDGLVVLISSDGSTTTDLQFDPGIDQTAPGLIAADAQGSLYALTYSSGLDQGPVAIVHLDPTRQ